MTAEAAVIGEITIIQHTQQDKSVLDVLTTAVTFSALVVVK